MMYQLKQVLPHQSRDLSMFFTKAHKGIEFSGFNVLVDVYAQFIALTSKKKDSNYDYQ